ncbi:MAG: stage II sporulation protein P [Oscillospiraceae bacterium]|nr:stage II sporulation protein P [Oscillospiraceae bacterium]
MNIKKGFAAGALVLFGLFAVHAVRRDPRAMALLGRLAGEGLRVSAPVESTTAGEPARETAGAAEVPEAELSLPPFPHEVEIPKKEAPPEASAVILPTTIAGGMVLTNSTSYEPDLSALLAAGSAVRLSPDGPQILIIHTHGSEAYTPGLTDSYELTDNYRTEDPAYSVIRVGDELAACLESYGLRVIHDREIYDYPSYTGSYGRSEQAVKKYLEQYPSVSVVLDVHRDAIGDGDVVYKTVAEAGGKPCSQVMLLAGTGENGLEHPNWKENLKFALFLQSAIVKKHPSLARPIALKKERYNQHLSTGSLILEVGSSGNTLEEALNAVRLFADAAAPALKDLG